MSTETRTSRRAFLNHGVSALAGAGIATVLVLASGRAQSAEALSTDDPTAKALQFTPDASKVDPAKSPTFKAGSHCANCALYQKAQAANDRAPCAAFANKLVPAAGWCAAWVKAPD